MKKFLIGTFLFALAIGLNFAFVSTANAEQVSQLEKRQIQTRTFANVDKTTIMKAMLNVLQDEGYIVNNANPLLGFISGTKEFDTSDKTVDFQQEFGLKKGSYGLRGVRVATIEATANVSEYGNEIRVRINFTRKLLNVYGNAQSIDEISDRYFYRDFFEKVDKAIYIQKQQI